MKARWYLCLLGGVVLLLGGCLGPVAACSGSLAPPTPTRAPPEATLDPELVELRELGLAYWDTFNAYDVEGVLAFLEPSYREEREATLRKEIRLLRTFRVKLGVSVASEPEFTEPGEAEMYLRLKEPLGSRSILMRFERVEGRWMIAHAQEVEKGQ